VSGVTGVDDPYEEPVDAELVLDTTDRSVQESVDAVLDHLAEAGWVDL
jgi:sulfate adenylyltransferase